MPLPIEVTRLVVYGATELRAGVEPLLRAAQHPASLQRLLHQAGWDVDGLLDPTHSAAIVEAIEALESALNTVFAGPLEATEVLEVGAALGESVAALLAAATILEPPIEAALNTMTTGSGTSNVGELAIELAKDIADVLAIRWLLRTSPTVFSIARFVGLITRQRKPALYIEPPPLPVDSDGDGVDDRQLPVRWAMPRMAFNVDAMSNPFVLGLMSFLEDLPPEAYRSPAAFIAAVQAIIGQRIEDFLAELANRPIGVITVTVDGNGVSLAAPNWLPTSLVPWDNDLTIELNDPAASGSTMPPLSVVLAADRWSLLWDTDRPGEPPDSLSLFGNTLLLVERFEASNAAQPRVELTVDATDLDAITVSFVLTLGFRLHIAEGLTDEIAITAHAEWDDGLDVGFRAEVLDALEIPILVPGLTGLALVADKPSIEMTATDLDTDPRLDLEVSIDGFGVRLPAPFFRRAEKVGEKWQLAELQPAPLVSFTLAGDADSAMPPLLSLGVSGAEGGGLELDRFELLPVGDNWTITLSADPMFIGFGENINTGIVIQVDPTTYTAEPGSIGTLHVAKALVHLPPDLPVPLEEIVISDATIDEDGFSGEVAFAFAEPPENEEPEKLFGALPIAFQSISLVIEGNLPTEFEVKAAVEMPYFDEWVDVTIGFDDDFNLSFLVESVDPEGITMTKEELLLLNFRSAFFEWRSEEQSVALELSGGIEPLLWNADGLEWPRLDVTKLRVEQDVAGILAGEPEPPLIRFEEAWLDLKDLATLDLFGFHFELNRIGMGYVEATDELWVDLTGSLRLIELLPIGVGVEGFRITWPRRIYEELGIGVDNDGLRVDLTVDQALELASRIQVKFDGIYLFFGVPQAVEFEGYIRFIKTAQKIGFAGDVALRLPATGLAIEAGLMVGMNFAEPAPYPFLYVYFGILLPTGIPLGQSGLALKGAKGLFGLNVEPDREPEENPYYDWYKRGPIEGAHPTNKWRDKIWSIAFGAGITITTTDGKILGVQGLLALVIPGPIIFVEGKALIFDGLFPGDSPLKALGYFDGNELTAQLNIEASMELVEGVVDVMAGIEAFFDFRNLLNWHLYVGVDEPLDRRVHANVLKLPAIGWLFRADAYLMIDMPAGEALDGVPLSEIELDDLAVRARMGVHIGFEPPAIDLVVASAEVHAVIAGEGLLTINPFLFNGSAALDAVIDVDVVSLVSVSAEATAEMSIEGALPLIVDANIAASVDLPVPDVDAVPIVGDYLAGALDWFEETVVDLPEIPDHLEVEIPFHWELDCPPVLDPLVTGVSVESRFAQGGTDALRLGSTSDASGAAGVADAPVVPLDARPVITFDQNVNLLDHLEFGGFSAGALQRFFAGKLAFQPLLRSVRIFELANHLFVDGESEDWVEISSTELSGDDELWGMFRPAGEFTGSSRAGRRILEVWGADPFEFLTGSIPLEIPGDSASSGGSVAPLDGLGIGDVPWCDESEAVERCVGRDEIKQAVLDGSPVPEFVPHFGSWRQQITLGPLVFTAPDVRLTEDKGGEYVAELDGPDRKHEFAMIDFPERVVRATVQVLDDDTQISARRRVLTGRVSSGFVYTPTSATADLVEDDGAGDDDTFVFKVADPAGFDRIELGGRDTVRVVEVCWFTADAVAGAEVRKRECDANGSVAPRASDPGVVLSAGAHYRVEVETSIELDEGQSDGAALALASLPGFSGAIQPYRSGQGGPFVVTDSFHFRTEGPPSDLRPYVKWLSPADGSDRHFTDDDLAIRFNRPYIHRLYPDPDNGAAGPDGSPYALDVVVEDPEGRVRTDWFLNWTTAASSTLVPEEQHWFDDIAPQSAPGVTPPPDDVLEVRRRLDVRSFGDIATWVAESIPVDPVTTSGIVAPVGPTTSPGRVNPGGPIGVRPTRRSTRRVKWKQTGTDTVTAALAGSTGTYLHVADGRAWGPSLVAVDALPVDDGGTVGVVVNYVDSDQHYQVRLVGGSESASATVEIVRVVGGAEKVLASRPVVSKIGSRRGGSITGRQPSPTRGPTARGAQFPGITPTLKPVVRPTRFVVRTERSGPGVKVTCRVGRVAFSVVDNEAVADEGSIGLLAAGTDATFSRLSVGSIDGALDPATRYQVTIAGGAGGRIVHQDQFAGGPADWWSSSTGWSPSPAGMNAAVAGAVLDYGQPFDDGELCARIGLTSGERLAVGLRTPDDRRAPGATGRYEVEFVRTGAAVSALLSVWASETDVPVLIAAGATDVGAEAELDVRVRLIGDRVRVWVFDRELVDSGLGTTASAGVAIIRRGGIDLRSNLGTPVVSEVQLRDAGLFTFGFATSAAASFAELVDEFADGGLGPASVRGAQTGHRSAIAAAAASRRASADAEIAVHSANRYFALRRATRVDVESARQAALDAGAVHDEQMANLLDGLGAGPLVVPTEPSIHRIETKSGLILGWVLRSPSPLDPIAIAGLAASPLDNVGRTSFELAGADGSAVATHWVSSTDGTTIVVYRIAEGAVLTSTSPASALAAVFVDDVPESLTVTRRRDFADDTANVDHTLDRPYELTQGSRANIVRRIPLP